MRQSSIRFNAGKVAFDEDTKRCTPLPHKGYITIVPGTDDPDFLQFTWKCKDATAGGAVEPDELVLIPGDVTFKHVKSCTTGRVVALTFLSSGAKHLYWLQDVGDIDNLALLTPKDEAILKDVVEAVALDDDDDEEMETPPATKSGTITSETRSETIGSETPSQTPSQTTTSFRRHPIHEIGDVLTPAEIERHLSRLTPAELQQKYGHLIPESMSASVHDIMELVRCGFFHQAQARLSQSVAGPGAAVVAGAVGYSPEGAGVEAMLRGIRHQQHKPGPTDDNSHQDTTKDTNEDSQ